MVGPQGASAVYGPQKGATLGMVAELVNWSQRRDGMGNGRFCAKLAGFLRKVHSECQERHNAGGREILSLVREAVKKHSALAQLKAAPEGLPPTAL